MRTLVVVTFALILSACSNATLDWDAGSHSSRLDNDLDSDQPASQPNFESTTGRSLIDFATAASPNVVATQFIVQGGVEGFSRIDGTLSRVSLQNLNDVVSTTEAPQSIKFPHTGSYGHASPRTDLDPSIRPTINFTRLVLTLTADQSPLRADIPGDTAKQFAKTMEFSIVFDATQELTFCEGVTFKAELPQNFWQEVFADYEAFEEKTCFGLFTRQDCSEQLLLATPYSETFPKGRISVFSGACTALEANQIPFAPLGPDLEATAIPVAPLGPDLEATEILVAPEGEDLEATKVLVAPEGEDLKATEDLFAPQATELEANELPAELLEATQY